MSDLIGEKVKFKSPTGNAVLVGQVVLMLPVEEMFDDYPRHPKYEFDKGTMICSIRVEELIKTEKEDYKKPTVCKIQQDKIISKI